MRGIRTNSIGRRTPLVTSMAPDLINLYGLVPSMAEKNSFMQFKHCEGLGADAANLYKAISFVMFVKSEGDTLTARLVTDLHSLRVSQQRSDTLFDRDVTVGTSEGR